MGYPDINLLHMTVKIYGLSALFFVIGADFFLFVWLLCGAIIGVLLEYFALLHRVHGAMYQECFFNIRTITRTACMICLELDGAALLRVFWQGGFSYLMFSAMTGTVGFRPVSIFRSVTTFVNLLYNLHTFEYFACILVGTSLEILAL